MFLWSVHLMNMQNFKRENQNESFILHCIKLKGQEVTFSANHISLKLHSKPS